MFAYASATSRNTELLDGSPPAGSFIGSVGASSNDLWIIETFSYSHSLDSRNDIIGTKVSISKEYDSFSLGFGRNYSKLFNEKNTDKFSRYLSCCFYNSTAAYYFFSNSEALSTDKFYTSDFDLSQYDANQYGFGINYTDIFAKLHIAKFDLKSVNLEYNYYKRNSGLSSSIITAGFKFVMD
ncbi:MAG: hypothetical protein ACI840_000037 [Ulvibacter sp.]